MMDASSKPQQTPPTTESRERSLPGQLSEITSETIELFRKELRLAKLEMNEKFDQAKRGVGSMVSGSMVLAGGLLTILAAAVLGIGLYMPYWGSALVVGGAVSLIGAIMLGAGRKELEPEQLKPQRTLDELDRDKRLIQEHA